MGSPFGNIVSKAKSAIDDLFKDKGQSKAQRPRTSLKQFNKESKANSAAAFQKTIETDIYDTSVTAENWFTALPYGFQFINRKGERQTIYLPISPNNLNITTHYATNVVTTLYGTVEEHSEQRYFDITISGTTGYAPKYVKLRDIEYFERSLKKTVRGRQSWDVSSEITIPALGGFFNKTIDRINGIINKASDTFSERENESGVDINRSGYTAFHNLYKFFLQYKKDTAGVTSVAQRGEHPLWFLNYKDNNKYKCAIQRFTLKRNASDPMLYNYDIVLRAYEIQPVGERVRSAFRARIRDLGLDGVEDSSLFGDIKNTSNNLKGVVGSIVGGINVFGR